jgi:hypothetical protein
MTRQRRISTTSIPVIHLHDKQKDDGQPPTANYKPQPSKNRKKKKKKNKKKRKAKVNH